MINQIKVSLKEKAYRDKAFGALDVFDGGPRLFVNRDDGDVVSIAFSDIYLQAFRSDQVTLEDKIMAAFAWQKILTGRMIYGFLEVRSTPFSDANFDSNNAVLKELVDICRPEGWYDLKDAQFYGGPGAKGQDGHVEFNTPFIKDFVGQAIEADGERCAPKGPFHGVKTLFPLEVGFCLPSQIEMHLAQCRSVVRWPYGCKYLIFLEEYNEAISAPGGSPTTGEFRDGSPGVD